jgi:hypothetical protein
VSGNRVLDMEHVSPPTPLPHPRALHSLAIQESCLVKLTALLPPPPTTSPPPSYPLLLLFQLSLLTFLIFILKPRPLSNIPFPGHHILLCPNLNPPPPSFFPPPPPLYVVVVASLHTLRLCLSPLLPHLSPFLLFFLLSLPFPLSKILVFRSFLIPSSFQDPSFPLLPCPFLSQRS